MARRNSDCAQPLSLAMSAAQLDNRASPGETAPGSLRKILNWEWTEQRKFRRRPGFDKLFSRDPYNNEDLHDQLLAAQTYYADGADAAAAAAVTSWPNAACSGGLLSRPTGRQPITLLFQATSTYGSRKLLAASESRIYGAIESTGNWKLLADGLGLGIDDGTCPRRRFYASQNQNAVLFTNNYDAPRVWLFDQAIVGCAQQSVTTIPDLELIGLTKAAVTWTWRNVTFLANVEMDHRREPQRIVWSDFANPLSWDPAKPESITGFQDLDYGEEILGGAELGDLFVIYTTKRIWQMTVSGGGRVFAFNKRYSPKHTGEGCLFYRNTLATFIDGHLYAGRDGWYGYDLYQSAPQRVPWLHQATGDMFSNLSEGFCENTIAGYNPKTKELLAFWVPKASNTGFPLQGLAVNPMYGKVSELDFGATALCFYQRDQRGTVRDFIVENCICSEAELAAMGYGYIKEGLPLPRTAEPCTPITSIYSTEPLTIDGLTTEDYTAAETSPGSLCEKLGDSRWEDECDQCPEPSVFVLAHSTDWCLKQLSEDSYARELCTNPADIGSAQALGYQTAPGVYQLAGYDSILLSNANSFHQQRNEKTLHRFAAQIEPLPQTVPNDITLRIGLSQQPSDPLDIDSCTIVWRDQKAISLTCVSARNSEQHKAAHSKPSNPFQWPLFLTGVYSYWQLKITGTGGGCSIGEVTQDVSLESTCANW